MERLILCASAVTLVGGGPLPSGAIARALALAPTAVGADSGGDVVLPPGYRFAAVIGDLDSLRGATLLRAQGVPLHRVAEQDSTDLEKCLSSIEAPLILGVGFLGGRLDHTLAAMNVLVRYAHRPVVLVGAEDLCFVCPAAFAMDLAPGTRVSLFAMAPATGLLSEGLRWSVAGLAMAPDGRCGTSNEALGGRLRLGFDAPAVLVMLPADLLEETVAALTGGTADRIAVET